MAPGGVRATSRVLDVTLLDYDLPEALIAQRPLAERDGARLLVLDPDRCDIGARGGRSSARTHDEEPDAKRDSGALPYGRAPRREARSGRSGLVIHAAIRDLPEFVRPALWVVNDTRVLPARLFARKRTGGRVEIFLLERTSEGRWLALGRASKPLREGDCLTIEGTTFTITIVSPARPQDGAIEVELEVDAERALSEIGHVPLPPYIRRPDEPEDRTRYQTVFASHPGAVAAPTAGLHFTERSMAALEARGHRFTRVTLHVGAGTFRPVKARTLDEHPMHEERYVVSSEAAAAIADARAEGMPIVAVGTTVVRTLESAATDDGLVRPGAGSTRLFIRPPYTMRVADGLLTNFHQPRSTLLALVMAIAGVEPIRKAYAEAVAARYRFLSYGDAMLIRSPKVRP